MQSVPSIIDAFWVSTASKRKKPTALQRYQANNAPACILNFVKMGGGASLGVALEEFARFKFKNLEKRKKGKDQSGHDHLIHTPAEIRVEQKSSTIWATNDYKFQHVETKHDWQMLLLCGVGYTDIHFWALSKPAFHALVASGKITNQGNKAGDSSEGMWFTYSNVADSLTEIRTEAELQAFAAAL